jgi:hypothetical protein
MVLAVVMREGKKEVGVDYRRMLMCAVCSMHVCSGWMQMQGRQKQQRWEQRGKDLATPR